MSSVICSKEGANPTPLIAPTTAFSLCKLCHCFASLNVFLPQRGEIRLCGLLRPFQCPDLSKNTGQSQLLKNQQVRGITLTILLYGNDLLRNLGYWHSCWCHLICTATDRTWTQDLWGCLVVSGAVHYWWILRVLWVARQGILASDLIGHRMQTHDQIEIWELWRLGWHLDFFVTFLGPCPCLDEVFLVCHGACTGGACQVATTWIPGPKVFQQNIAL